MKLHGYWRSSSSYRMRILLNLKGVDYEYVPVHLLKDGGQQNAPEFTAKSPLAQVPVLELQHQGSPRYLSQSVAMAEYLEETVPQPPLFPEDPWARARAREMAEIINSGIQPLQNLRVLLSLKAMGADARAWCREVIGRGFYAVEARLQETAGRFAIGDTPGLVDAFIVPQMYAARRFQVELEAFPQLVAVDAACADHLAFVKAHPDRQSDAPPPEERTP